jgi:hypothetical protein
MDTDGDDPAGNNGLLGDDAETFCGLVNKINKLSASAIDLPALRLRSYCASTAYLVSRRAPIGRR